MQHTVAIVVDTATNNPTRTVANVRSYFNKLGGAMGTSGSVEYAFQKKALFKFNKAAHDIEELEFELIDAGLSELQVERHLILAYADFVNYGKSAKALEQKGIEIVESTYEKIPDFKEGLTDEQAEEVIKTIDKLEEDDDVTFVFHNME